MWGYNDPMNQRTVGLVALVAAAIFLAAAVIPHLGHSLDDAFITYRYARNLAEGQGLVYNPGEHHLGTTSPGWAMVLAFMGLIIGVDSIPVISGFLSALALVASLILLSRRLDSGRWLLVFGLSLVLSASCRWFIEVLGFEGFALTAVVIVALLATDSKRPGVAGLLWAFAVMLRPDAGLLGAVAGLIEWRRTRKFPWLLAVAFICGLLVAIGAVWLAAGAVVPASFAVKTAEANESVFANTGGYTEHMALWGWAHCGWAWIAFGGFATSGWVLVVRSNPTAALPVLAVAVTSLVTYPLLGVPFAPWYLILPLVIIVVGFAFMLVHASTTPGLKPLAILGVAILIAWAFPQISWAVHLGKRPPDGRMPHMLEAASRVSELASPDDKVMTIEIGFLGFALRQPIVDVIGLGTPGSLDAIISGQLVDHVYEQQPDFLVYNTNFFYLLEPFFSDPRFGHDWVLESVIPPRGRHRTAIEIYRHIGSGTGETYR